MVALKLVIVVLLSFLHDVVNTQDLVSPCPRLFIYERKSSEPDKWYGIITLLSDTDLSGVWLRVQFDRPSLQLGNWFGQAQPRNENKEYVIKNRDFQLKAGTPQVIRFFVKYDVSQPPPKLVGFRLNARMLCPEGAAEDSVSVEPQTSAPVGGPASSVVVITAPSVVGNVDAIRPGGINLGSLFESNDGFSSNVDRPQQNPLNDKELKEICGTVANEADAPVPLITHGELTREGEFPWHAAIYQTKGVNLDYLCGASLVTKYHIITAAHCVTKWKTQTPRSADSLVIYLGRYYLHRFTEGIQERLVADIIPHHQYNPQRLSNDIAAVKFTMPVKITDYVRPICLWQDSSELNAIVSKLGSVVGWGFDETGKLTEQLMQAKMPVVSQETCLRSVPDFFPLFTSNRTFCAGFQNGTSVCNGDSGGGMVFPKSTSNSPNLVWQLRGIVSLSVDLKKTFKCDSNHYIVFTDTAKHIEWIKQALQQ